MVSPLNTALYFIKLWKSINISPKSYMLGFLCTKKVLDILFCLHIGEAISQYTFLKCNESCKVYLHKVISYNVNTIVFQISQVIWHLKQNAISDHLHVASYI